MACAPSPPHPELVEGCGPGRGRLVGQNSSGSWIGIESCPLGPARHVGLPVSYTTPINQGLNSARGRGSFRYTWGLEPCSARSFSKVKCPPTGRMANSQPLRSVSSSSKFRAIGSGTAGSPRFARDDGHHHAVLRHLNSATDPAACVRPARPAACVRPARFRPACRRNPSDAETAPACRARRFLARRRRERARRPPSACRARR